jgi:hypothetical protein
MSTEMEGLEPGSCQGWWGTKSSSSLTELLLKGSHDLGLVEPFGRVDDKCLDHRQGSCKVNSAETCTHVRHLEMYVKVFVMDTQNDW